MPIDTHSYRESKYTSDPLYKDDNESLLPAALLDFLRTLRALLMKFDQWAIEPHEIASSRLMVLEDDLHQLKHYMDSIHHSLGTPVTLQGTDFPDVWCALEFLSQSASGQDFGATVAHVQHSLFNLAQQVGEVQNGFKSIQSLVHALPAAQEQLSQLAVQLHLHEKRFTLIQPLLLSIPKLSEDIAALKTTTCVSTDPWTANFAPQPHVIPPSPSGSTPVESTVDAITRLNTIEHAIQSLEKRVVGDGIKIGRFLFQSKEDLRLWGSSPLYQVIASDFSSTPSQFLTSSLNRTWIARKIWLNYIIPKRMASIRHTKAGSSPQCKIFFLICVGNQHQQEWTLL